MRKKQRSSSRGPKPNHEDDIVDSVLAREMQGRLRLDEPQGTPKAPKPASQKRSALKKRDPVSALVLQAPPDPSVDDHSDRRRVRAAFRRFAGEGACVVRAMFGFSPSRDAEREKTRKQKQDQVRRKRGFADEAALREFLKRPLVDDASKLDHMVILALLGYYFFEFLIHSAAAIDCDCALAMREQAKIIFAHQPMYKIKKNDSYEKMCKDQMKPAVLPGDDAEVDQDMDATVVDNRFTRAAAEVDSARRLTSKVGLSKADKEARRRKRKKEQKAGTKEAPGGTGSGGGNQNNNSKRNNNSRFGTGTCCCRDKRSFMWVPFFWPAFDKTMSREEKLQNGYAISCRTLFVTLAVLGTAHFRAWLLALDSPYHQIRDSLYPTSFFPSTAAPPPSFPINPGTFIATHGIDPQLPFQGAFTRYNDLRTMSRDEAHGSGAAAFPEHKLRPGGLSGPTDYQTKTSPTKRLADRLVDVGTGSSAGTSSSAEQHFSIDQFEDSVGAPVRQYLPKMLKTFDFGVPLPTPRPRYAIVDRLMQMESVGPKDSQKQQISRDAMQTLIAMVEDVDQRGTATATRDEAPEVAYRPAGVENVHAGVGAHPPPPILGSQFYNFFQDLGAELADDARTLMKMAEAKMSFGKTTTTESFSSSSQQQSRSAPPTTGSTSPYDEMKASAHKQRLTQHLARSYAYAWRRIDDSADYVSGETTARRAGDWGLLSDYWAQRDFVVHVFEGHAAATKQAALLGINMRMVYYVTDLALGPGGGSGENGYGFDLEKNFQSDEHELPEPFPFVQLAAVGAPGTRQAPWTGLSDPSFALAHARTLLLQGGFAEVLISTVSNTAASKAPRAVRGDEEKTATFCPLLRVQWVSADRIVWSEVPDAVAGSLCGVQKSKRAIRAMKVAVLKEMNPAEVIAAVWERGLRDDLLHTKTNDKTEGNGNTHHATSSGAGHHHQQRTGPTPTPAPQIVVLPPAAGRDEPPKPEKRDGLGGGEVERVVSMGPLASGARAPSSGRSGSRYEEEAAALVDLYESQAKYFASEHVKNYVPGDDKLLQFAMYANDRVQALAKRSFLGGNFHNSLFPAIERLSGVEFLEQGEVVEMKTTAKDDVSQEAGRSREAERERETQSEIESSTLGRTVIDEEDHRQGRLPLMLEATLLPDSGREHDATPGDSLHLSEKQAWDAILLENEEVQNLEMIRRSAATSSKSHSTSSAPPPQEQEKENKKDRRATRKRMQEALEAKVVLESVVRDEAFVARQLLRYPLLSLTEDQTLSALVQVNMEAVGWAQRWDASRVEPGSRAPGAKAARELEDGAEMARRASTAKITDEQKQMAEEKQASSRGHRAEEGKDPCSPAGTCTCHSNSSTSRQHSAASERWTLMCPAPGVAAGVSLTAYTTSADIERLQRPGAQAPAIENGRSKQLSGQEPPSSARTAPPADGDDHMQVDDDSRAGRRGSRPPQRLSHQVERSHAPTSAPAEQDSGEAGTDKNRQVVVKWPSDYLPPHALGTLQKDPAESPAALFPYSRFPYRIEPGVLVRCKQEIPEYCSERSQDLKFVMQTSQTFRISSHARCLYTDVEKVVKQCENVLREGFFSKDDPEVAQRTQTGGFLFSNKVPVLKAWEYMVGRTDAEWKKELRDEKRRDLDAAAAAGVGDKDTGADYASTFSLSDDSLAQIETGNLFARQFVDNLILPHPPKTKEQQNAQKMTLRFRALVDRERGQWARLFMYFGREFVADLRETVEPFLSSCVDQRVFRILFLERFPFAPIAVPKADGAQKDGRLDYLRDVDDAFLKNMISGWPAHTQEDPLRALSYGKKEALMATKTRVASVFSSAGGSPGLASDLLISGPEVESSAKNPENDDEEYVFDKSIDFSFNFPASADVQAEGRNMLAAIAYTLDRTVRAPQYDPAWIAAFREMLAAGSAPAGRAKTLEEQEGQETVVREDEEAEDVTTMRDVDAAFSLAQIVMTHEEGPATRKDFMKDISKFRQKKTATANADRRSADKKARRSPSTARIPALPTFAQLSHMVYLLSWTGVELESDAEKQRRIDYFFDFQEALQLVVPHMFRQVNSFQHLRPLKKSQSSKSTSSQSTEQQEDLDGGGRRAAEEGVVDVSLSFWNIAAQIADRIAQHSRGFFEVWRANGRKFDDSSGALMEKLIASLAIETGYIFRDLFNDPRCADSQMVGRGAPFEKPTADQTMGSG
eukprot:g2804.t1